AIVIDEADRVLQMNGGVAASKILNMLPKERLLGLFSATQAASIPKMSKLGAQEAR
ncbi:hypothetical protein KIPB_016233, partial [Kipferlia bialata]